MPRAKDSRAVFLQTIFAGSTCSAAWRQACTAFARCLLPASGSTTHDGGPHCTAPLKGKIASFLFPLYASTPKEAISFPPPYLSAVNHHPSPSQLQPGVSLYLCDSLYL